MERLTCLRNLAFAGLVSTVMLSGVSCKKEEAKPEPGPAPVELKDQIEYNGGDLIDIKSAVYEIDRNGVYTFYLSPTSGITEVDGMEEADDYLKLSVKSPKGLVDVKNDEFELSYADIKVSDKSMQDVKILILNASVVKETSVLNLYVELEMASGKTLLVRYGNKAVLDAPAVLENQLELDGQVTDIGSVLECYDFADKSTTYYFYGQEGVTVPSDGTPAAMQITVADGYSLKDLSLTEADLDKVSVTSGSFVLENGTEGTLSVSRQTLTGKLEVKIDAENTKGHLRADYLGDAMKSYKSTNTLKVTQGENVSETALNKVFLYSQNGSYTFMLGTQDAQTPEGLKEGGYAMKFVVSELTLGNTENFPDGNFGFSLYSYADYSVWEKGMATGEGATGSLTVVKDGDAYYIRLNAEFKDGVKSEVEWYGVPAAASENTDIKPVEPFRPRIYITKSDGSVVVDKDLVSMEMRMEKDFELRGGEKYGGATFDAYFFYFRPEDATGGVEDRYSTPVIMIPASFIGSENLDMSKPQTDLYWSFIYQSGGLQAGSSGYSENYTMGGSSTYGNCPKEVTVTAIKNDDKTWSFTFRMLDRYLSYGIETGSGNTVLIEWDGPATKYSGTKKNDLTDADY